MKVYGSLGVSERKAVHHSVRHQEALETAEVKARKEEAAQFLAALRLTDSDAPFPLPPRRSNGFGGRNKTHRMKPEQSRNEAQQSIEAQLEHLDVVRSRIETEINAEDRLFYKWGLETIWDGTVYERKVITYDKPTQEALRVRERATLTVAVDAVKIGIFELHPRMRGFPGSTRLVEDPSAYTNVMHLRSSINECSRDPLLQMMLTDVENRFAHPLYNDRPNYFGEYEAYRPRDTWDDFYDSDHARTAMAS